MPDPVEIVQPDLTDPEHVAGMSEKDIIENLNPSAAPAEPSPTDTPTKETPAAPEPTQPAASAPAEKLLAGKYKTPDDLAKGLTEIAKPLNIHPLSLTTAINMAKKTGDWSEVEQLYTELQAELSTKPPTPPPTKEGEPPVAGQPAPASDKGELTNEKIQQLVTADVKRRLAQHPIRQKFERKGVSWPTTVEEVEELEDTYPVLAIELREAMRDIYTTSAKEFNDYAEALMGVGQATDNAKSEGVKQITALSEKYKLDLKPEEVNTLVQQALDSGSPTVFEDKHGVKHPTAQGIVKWIKAETDLFDRLNLASTQRGRAAHSQDLRTMKEKTLSSISTAGLPAKRQRTETPEVDVNDPDQVSKMTEQEILERLDGK
jgi:hypothetical protein